MAHGVSEVLSDGSIKMVQQQSRKSSGVMGSRRIFAATFKLKVLDSYRKDVDCRGNQRATARKYGIHRRQIQKWLQCEDNLRSICAETSVNTKNTPSMALQTSSSSASPNSPAPALNLSLTRLHGDEPPPTRHPVHPPLLTGFNEYPDKIPTQHHHHHHHHSSQDVETEQKYYVLNHGNFEGRFNYHQLPYQSSMVSLHNPETPSPTIKSEPASPDTVAPSSPAMSTTTAVATRIYHAELQPETGMDAVHFSTHVHDSEKPDGQLERVTMAAVKKEMLEEEIIVEERGTSNYEDSERSIAISPRVISSSSSGNSSSSDSEIDPLEFHSSPQTVNGDLSRRRSFSLKFKLDVLDAFHGDPCVAGNQRATARKFGINRRQVQKWLGQESELRGEIALRGGGDLRQRLGPLQESPRESPVDLRTASSPLYCCDSSTQQLNYYTPGSEVCTHSCCTDSVTNFSVASRGCYSESRSFYCYSPRDHVDITRDGVDRSSFKRSACTMGCYYGLEPSSKRVCIEEEPQDRPLCLVMPKMNDADVTTTMPAPPKKDFILFKPYLDNPISKPSADETSVKTHGINNNCHSVCNLNEEGISKDYALEFRFRVPISWGSQHISAYPDTFPEGIRSAFMRYPTSPHYT